MVTKKIADLPVLTMEYVEVTPDMAWDFLSRTTIKNRFITQSTVHKYARQIMAERWCVTGEALKFDDLGNLLDGQHRLWGFIETGLESAVFLVINNIPASSQPFIDTPKPRTPANTLEMEGVPDPRIAAATVKMLNEYEHNRMPGSSAWRVALDNQGIYQYTLDHPDVLTSVSAVADSKGLKDLGKPATVAFTHCVTSRLNPTVAADFWRRIAEADYDGIGDPVQRIRERLIIARRQPHSTVSPTMTAALIFKAWNAAVRGRTIGNLNWVQRGEKMEKFPAPIATARGGRKPATIKE
jgi:hypothetical protein